MQAQRERERTEARFLSDQLLEQGRWHHVMVVLNKALIRNSTCALFVDGKHVATCRVSIHPFSNKISFENFLPLEVTCQPLKCSVS